MNLYNKPNKLIGEKSPYLLQHAYNPVEWYPWGGEAFERAKAENKPIFLSIGYSTCHWCHVMEHESFEDTDTAKLMNSKFINIKVDREERPDIDRIYMAAVQAISGSGGWPMSVFIDHDLQPFFGGTYFPPEPAYGRPGFTQVLTQVSRLWEYEHHRIADSAQSISDYLSKITAPGGKDAEIGQHTIAMARNQIMSSYDAMYGGFGAAPKFPRPSVLNFLFGIYKQNGEKEVLEASLHTLREMAQHGMHDHVGGGFHRYSVDREWKVPHFEKMLYDQAQLINSYIDAYLVTGEEFYGDVAKGTLRYVQRDMSSPEGGFYSAEDADSLPDGDEESGRKVEGAFYVWEKQEIESIPGIENAEIFCYIYGVREDGNVTPDPRREFVNKNILYTANPVDKAAQEFGKSPDRIDEIISSSLASLSERRQSRPRPHHDDKIITAWNGMMVSAFSRAYRAFGDSSYLVSAIAGADFILSSLINNEGGLYRRYRDGEARFDGMLEDYAATIAGLTDLYEASFNPYYINKAVELQEKQIKIFWDYQNKGFYETGDNDKSVIIRMKEYYDGAEPAGNSISLLNLLRLSHITGNTSFYHKANELTGAFSSRIEQSPASLPQLLFGILYKLNNPKLVIIAGEADQSDTQEALLGLERVYDPFREIILADEANKTALSDKLEVLNNIKKVDGKITLYLCENNKCRAPVAGIEEIRAALGVDYNQPE